MMLEAHDVHRSARFLQCWFPAPDFKNPGPAPRQLASKATYHSAADSAQTTAVTPCKVGDLMYSTYHLLTYLLTAVGWPGDPFTAFCPSIISHYCLLAEDTYRTQVSDEDKNLQTRARAIRASRL